MSSKISKIAVIIFCLSFVLSVKSFAESSKYYPSDISNHWAKSHIENWVERGFIKGYSDSTFRPDASITRAEFVTIINNLFGYKEKGDNSFIDVSEKDWFYDEIAKARTIGYISGYNDGSMKPNNPITRQEAVAIICSILRLEQSDNISAISHFADSEKIPQWSRGFIITAVENGYISGYEDKTIRGDMPIKRAETVAMLHRVAGDIVNVSGVWGSESDTKTITGNVTLSTRDVTLKNVVINGGLYLTEGIGEGDITLLNVTVKGETLIAAGGSDSIKIINSNLSKTTVQKRNGNVRIEASGTTKIDNLIVKSGAKIQSKELTGEGYLKVDISREVSNETIEFKGVFNEIYVDASDAKIKILEGNVKNINVKEGSRGTIIEIAKTVVVSNLNTESVITVKGEGSITIAQVSVDGVTFEKAPNKIIDREGNVIARLDEKAKDADTTPVTGGGSTVPSTPEIPATPPVAKIISQPSFGLPTSEVKVKIDDEFILEYAIYFDGINLTSTTNGTVIVATGVLKNLDRIKVYYNDTLLDVN
ncbi:UNVERIFIED_CONTAM: S-layer family protein [Acetivibrio alkalicellulosi]